MKELALLCSISENVILIINVIYLLHNIRRAMQLKVTGRRQQRTITQAIQPPCVKKAIHRLKEMHIQDMRVKTEAFSLLQKLLNDVGNSQQGIKIELTKHILKLKCIQYTVKVFLDTISIEFKKRVGRI